MPANGNNTVANQDEPHLQESAPPEKGDSENSESSLEREKLPENGDTTASRTTTSNTCYWYGCHDNTAIVLKI